MFKSILVVGAMALTSLAQASSLHPCTPTVQAQPTFITCATGTVNYSIQIDTLMSPNTSMCRGENHLESKTAKLKVSDEKGLPIGQLVIYNGGFNYTTDPTGDATFESKAFSLDLKKCVTPINGGISFGN